MKKHFFCNRWQLERCLVLRNCHVWMGIRVQWCRSGKHKTGKGSSKPPNCMLPFSNAPKIKLLSYSNSIKQNYPQTQGALKVFFFIFNAPIALLSGFFRCIFWCVICHGLQPKRTSSKTVKVLSIARCIVPSNALLNVLRFWSCSKKIEN